MRKTEKILVNVSLLILIILKIPGIGYKDSLFSLPKGYSKDPGYRLQRFLIPFAKK